MDPWVILEELAGNGLENVAIEVKLDGELVTLTDRAFELAMAGAQESEEVSKEQLQAAYGFLGFTQVQEYQISVEAENGNESAQRAKQALILRQLVKHRANARKLAADALGGNPKAKQAIQAIREQALGSGPERNRARVAAFLLRDAMRWMERKASQPTPVESPATETVAAEGA